MKTLKNGKVRKDIDLEPSILELLQKVADSNNRKLKNHMEKVLINSTKKVK